MHPCRVQELSLVFPFLGYLEGGFPRSLFGAWFVRCFGAEVLFAFPDSSEAQAQDHYPSRPEAVEDPLAVVSCPGGQVVK